MKRIFVLAYTLLFFFSLSAQNDNAGSAGNDYRYFSLSTGIVNSLIISPNDNNFVLLETPYGDMLKHTAFLNYTPGVAFNIHYHMDSRNDKFGVTFGMGVTNFGMSMYYKIKVDTLTTFKLMDQYRTTSIVLPIIFKYNPKDLYFQQTYLTFGAKFYYNISVIDIQKASWGNDLYVGNLPDGAVNRMSYSLFLGGNYLIYYFSIELLLRNYVNKNYTVQTFEGISAPYKHLNYKTGFYITTGVHIPLTRWTTSRSWTAEKIRRMLRGQAF